MKHAHGSGDTAAAFLTHRPTDLVVDDKVFG
jgi:hypothetical protein